MYVFEKASIFDENSRIELRGEDSALQEEARGLETRNSDDGPLDGRGIDRRQATKTVFLSANTCMQPQARADTTTMDPPQLTMYVSTSSQNTSPGPNADMALQEWFIFSEGAVMVNRSVAEDVYFSISAPNVSMTLFDGGYNFEVAASTDELFHSYDDQLDANLVWVDSDAQAALLMTHNLTDASDPSGDNLMKQQPYVMFAQNEEDRSINGVRYSYCGLQNYAQIAATKNGKFASMVATSMTRRGLGNQVKQQFYFSGLNSSTSYQGILAGNGKAGVAGNGVAGGGGHVSRATNFATKSGKRLHTLYVIQCCIPIEC